LTRNAKHSRSGRSTLQIFGTPKGQYRVGIEAYPEVVDSHTQVRTSLREIPHIVPGAPHAARQVPLPLELGSLDGCGV
jgi:hypothetical protein